MMTVNTGRRRLTSASHSPATPTQTLMLSFVALYRKCSSVHLHKPLISAPFNRSSMRYTFQSSCHWIFANSGATHLCSAFPHRPLAPPFPHPLPFVSDPARSVLSTTFLSLLSLVLILRLTQCNREHVDESKGLSSLLWTVVGLLFLSLTPSLFRLALFDLLRIEAHLNICLPWMVRSPLKALKIDWRCFAASTNLAMYQSISP